MKKVKTPQELKSFQEEIQNNRDPQKPCITICAGTGCLTYGSQKLVDNFRAEVEKQNLNGKIEVRASGCHGFCERGPLVVINPQNIFYQRVGLDDAEEIIKETVLNGQIIDRLLYIDPVTREKILHEDEIPFYKRQMRLVFGMNGNIDPNSLEDYLAIGGYSALIKILNGMEPEAIIEEIKTAGLRGRGGGGFSMGLKWEATRNAPGLPKYIICNADEGDPGAYMDRSLLEGNPYLILEGMLIGAYAIGSNTGYIYVRNEYPLAVNNITIAVEKARNLGILGENILGSGFDFDVVIVRGGGAFVCGEETALIASIEGRSGEPRAKYVFPAERGLYNKPTNINNVETWANVPLIINKGAQWYRSIGTENSKGTKIFALVGKINNTGLVEVPMGITLREIVYDIGGGIPKGRKFKAVQVGGPSGGCIPESHLDLQVDFDALSKVGSMMGSGGLIVMDENSCMVDVAKYFIGFLLYESCGKCVPCREGLKQMHEILSNICQGHGEEGDVELLEEISDFMIEASLCALGGSAPNPVLSTIRYFRDEYKTHIFDKKCRAGVCRNLFEYFIDKNQCDGCTLCRKKCPEEAISGEKKEVHVIDPEKCINCGICFSLCKREAIRVR